VKADQSHHLKETNDLASPGILQNVNTTYDDPGAKFPEAKR